MNNKFKEHFFADVEQNYIVVDFFDNMLRGNYKKDLHYLAMDTSFGSETLGINLPSLFDSEDEDGYFDDCVEIYENDAEQRISFETYVKCLTLASQIYFDENGTDQEIVNDLEIIKDRVLNGGRTSV